MTGRAARLSKLNPADDTGRILQLGSGPTTPQQKPLSRYSPRSSIAHLAAARLGADAAGSYHGTRIGEHLDEVSQVTCPVSFHFGADDPFVPMDEVNAIKAAYAGRPNANIVTHAGASHNFAMP